MIPIDSGVGRINRLKAAVLALFGLYWIVVLTILIVDRPIFNQVAPLPPELTIDIAAFAEFTVLLALLSVGVVRGWRWTFWLILIVFLAGILRVPAAALQFLGRLPEQGPAWFVLLTAIVGSVQFIIAVAMLNVYRKTGRWGQSKKNFR